MWSPRGVGLGYTGEGYTKVEANFCTIKSMVPNSTVGGGRWPDRQGLNKGVGQ